MWMLKREKILGFFIVTLHLLMFHEFLGVVFKGMGGLHAYSVLSLILSRQATFFMHLCICHLTSPFLKCQHSAFKTNAKQADAFYASIFGAKNSIGRSSAMIKK